jgi:linoleate 10R-lipoxygenase
MMVTVLVNVINFYLDDAQKEHRDRITAAALGDERVSQAELEGYVREAIRCDPVTVGILRTPSQNRAITMLRIN